MMFDAFPTARALLSGKSYDANWGYDADWFRKALDNRGVAPCLPSRANRKRSIPYDKKFCRQRHKIENMFAKLKDWRHIHTRCDRCAHTFMSAICIAAAVTFWS